MQLGARYTGGIPLGVVERLPRFTGRLTDSAVGSRPAAIATALGTALDWGWRPAAGCSTDRYAGIAIGRWWSCVEDAGSSPNIEVPR